MRVDSREAFLKRLVPLTTDYLPAESICQALHKVTLGGIIGASGVGKTRSLTLPSYQLLRR